MLTNEGHIYLAEQEVIRKFDRKRSNYYSINTEKNKKNNGSFFVSGNQSLSFICINNGKNDYSELTCQNNILC